MKMANYRKYKKKNGQIAWQFQAYLGVDPVTEKRVKTTRRGFTTKKEAQRELRKLLHNIDENGLKSKKKIVTFQQLYTDWLAQYRLSVKPSTVALTIRWASNQILPKFGKLRLDKITVNYCQKVVREWYQQYRQYAFLKKEVQKILRYAVSQELIPSNPMQKIIMPRPKEPQHRINYYSREELEDFLNWTKQYPTRSPGKLYTFFRLLGFTGMRKSEALALQWRDIDFKNKTISIGKTIAQDEFYKVVVQPPKTENSVRTIDLDGKTMNTLKQWLMSQRKVNTILGNISDGSEQYLFTNLKNELYYPQVVNEWLNQIYDMIDAEYAKRAKAANTRLAKVTKLIDDKSLDTIAKRKLQTEATDLQKQLKKYQQKYHRLTPHGFRHTQASLLFEAARSQNIAGESILKDVMYRLGHKDIKTTMNIYTHVTQDSTAATGQMFATYMNF
ncbi:phage integrase [Loigolactobacillus rennini DSM 20253]|uniref:Phage integrase n=2 Tax=Loigolactobacillus rennini TaxID=238013 RepID=A0A0R2D3M8_9LACO|nr:phage integrase [Loigolactobacillus rennini DSM 20253]